MPSLIEEELLDFPSTDSAVIRMLVEIHADIVVGLDLLLRLRPDSPQAQSHFPDEVAGVTFI